MPKICTKCQCEKPLEDFPVDRKNADGRRYWCRSCCRVATRCWYKQNRERVAAYYARRYRAKADQFRAYSRAWKKANPKRTRLAHRDWVNRNKERVKELQRNWLCRHPEVAAAGRLARRRRMSGASGTCTPGQLAARISFYGWCCYLCGGPFEHVDHVIPVSRGGSNWPANLRPAWGPCNRRKGKRKLSEFQK